MPVRTVFRRLLLIEWSGLVAAIVVGSVALALIAPNFLTEFNLYVMLRSLSVGLLVAFAQMITLGIGQMNIAVGGIGGLVAIAFGGAMEVYGLPLALAVPFALAIGALAGLTNGMLIARSGVNAFIITLATGSAYTGINFGLTRSIPFYKMPSALVAFGDQHLGALPYLLVAPLIVAAMLGLFFSRSRAWAPVPGLRRQSSGGRALRHFACARDRVGSFAVRPDRRPCRGARRRTARIGSADHRRGLVASIVCCSDHRRSRADRRLYLGSWHNVRGFPDRADPERDGAGQDRSLLGSVRARRADPRSRRFEPLARGQQWGGPELNLAVESVTKSFPGVRALDGVSLDLKAGEVHALVGENGAGKSTLIKIVTGLYRPDSGTVLVDGRPVDFGSPRDALAAGVLGRPSGAKSHSALLRGENILLERLPTKGGFVDYGAVEREARRYLSLLDRDIDPRAEVRTLSVAQMQIVEIAKALSLEAKILLLDEPTASITEHEAAALFKLVRGLRDDGVAIVFVSHKLSEIFAIADRVTVLRDGKNVSDRRRRWPR